MIIFGKKKEILGNFESKLLKKFVKRLIARLDVKGENVIKGIHLEGLKIVGKPEELSKKYVEQNVDEIFFQDS